MHQPSPYGNPQPTGFTAPYMSQPPIQGQPTINMRVTPREPGIVQQPYNFNVPTTVDAGYNSKFVGAEQDDFFSSFA